MDERRERKKGVRREETKDELKPLPESSDDSELNGKVNGARGSASVGYVGSLGDGNKRYASRKSTDRQVSRTYNVETTVVELRYNGPCLKFRSWDRGVTHQNAESQTTSGAATRCL